MSTCANCLNMEPKNKNYDGDCWCGYHCAYRPPSDRACAHFIDAGRDNASDGCYITTALCNILGHADDCEIMQKLRGFRDNVMKNTAAYSAYLDEYNTIGPQISKSLSTDMDKTNIADKMLNNYILPAIVEIDKENADGAVNIYKEMVEYLQTRYLLHCF